jgi:hypothetical protein
MNALIKVVDGEGITLGTTTTDAIWVTPVMVLSIILCVASIVSAIVIRDFNDFYYCTALASLAILVFVFISAVIGIFSRPAYTVSCLTRSITVPIQNDGTDQARVCIAANELEREILARRDEKLKLDEIASGCK